MPRRMPLLQLVLCTLPLLGFAMPQAGDSLDEIRAFKPDDKYFKAGRVSLYFVIETSPVEMLAGRFDRTLKKYGSPTNAEWWH